MKKNATSKNESKRRKAKLVKERDAFLNGKKDEVLDKIGTNPLLVDTFGKDYRKLQAFREEPSYSDVPPPMKIKRKSILHKLEKESSIDSKTILKEYRESI